MKRLMTVGILIKMTIVKNRKYEYFEFFLCFTKYTLFLFLLYHILHDYWYLPTSLIVGSQ